MRVLISEPISFANAAITSNAKFWCAAIFGSAFAYFRQQYPEMQAAVSAFMPSYAAGLSMVSGGFETPVMVKEGRQTFERKRIGGKEVWEFVTKRRKGMGKTIESQIPMLPTIELISPIKKPRLNSLDEVKGKMVIIPS